MSEEQAKSSNLSRRNFLKLVGVAGVAAHAGGMAAAGVNTGASSEGYTGWESFNSGTQFFDRAPFEFNGPAHLPVEEVRRRPGHITDYVFGRVATFERAYSEHPEWTLDDPVEDLELPPVLEQFYKDFPERIEWDYKTFSETIPRNRQDRQKYGNYYKLADAYAAGFGAHGSIIPEPEEPPEESDFKDARGNPIGEQVPFKSPELAAEFIKEVAHLYGATIVGITTPIIDHFYAGGWRGCPEDYDYSKLPDHWQYMIVFGVPMEWDVIMASPQFSTSSDAYDRVSTTAMRLEHCLKHLGYAARAHSPYAHYDVVLPPHAIEAGLGEVSRAGFCLTPELGLNCRMAAITTNLPMKPDRPIDFGVEEFCKKCKLCAESCPSGAISMADSSDGMVIRGYEHWFINNGACYNYWRETMGPMGCRLCVATCPYSRKDNWIHDLARTIDPRDPTGLTSSGLLFMQKNFFDYPDQQDYRRPPDGHFASFRQEPEYMRAERFLDIDITSPLDE